MKRYTALALLTALVPAVVTAQDRHTSRDTLRGLKQVRVVVEELHADAEAAGLSREQLRTDVELRLRRSGVKVIDSPESSPFVYVQVSSLKLANKVNFAYAVDIGFRQAVTIDRNKIHDMAETWRTGVVGVVPSNDFVETVRRELGDELDKFINDYLAANQ